MCESLDETINAFDTLAPEHLQIQTRDPQSVACLARLEHLEGHAWAAEVRQGRYDLVWAPSE